mgnify:CR=1 FL=1
MPLCHSIRILAVSLLYLPLSSSPFRCLKDVRLGNLGTLALEGIVEAVDTQGSGVVDTELHVYIDATGDLRSDDPDALMPCRVSTVPEQRGLVIAVDNVHESLLDMVVSVGDDSIDGV